MLTFNILYREETITILGPNNNYIEITFPTSKEILDRNYKGNLNSFFLFQNDLKKVIKDSKSSSNQFIEFTNNIPTIWEKTPEIIKNKYKVLSEELEKLNKNKSSDLKILSFDPKNLGQKKKYKRKPKENHIRNYNKNKSNKEENFMSKLRDDKNVSLMKPKMNPPPVISSVIQPLNLPEVNDILMLPPDENCSSFQLMETGTLMSTSPPDVNYSMIPPTILMENTGPPPGIINYDQYSECLIFNEYLAYSNEFY
ncbi:hypothetical protein RclHR1_00070022 [Rhizophagus clarus]|uniref:HMG box domain-containing protein n=1 Tax=Rhizophagus clarus TaxID=94130 RepID=A0A2Z6S720_9GLOM|nr:hypothetical protein RclHR1_00070022 [Rhizophagus clarus]GES78194.1 hypothetical protein GLOIN_2v1873675 [Rhizophagus clarus]